MAMAVQITAEQITSADKYSCIYIFEPNAGYCLCIGPGYGDFILCLWYFYLSFLASCSQELQCRSFFFVYNLLPKLRSILMCPGACRLKWRRPENSNEVEGCRLRDIYCFDKDAMQYFLTMVSMACEK